MRGDPGMSLSQRPNGYALSVADPIGVDVKGHSDTRRHQCHDPVAVNGVLGYPQVKSVAKTKVPQEPVEDTPRFRIPQDEGFGLQIL